MIATPLAKALNLGITGQPPPCGLNSLNLELYKTKERHEKTVSAMEFQAKYFVLVAPFRGFRVSGIRPTGHCTSDGISTDLTIILELPKNNLRKFSSAGDLGTSFSTGQSVVYLECIFYEGKVRK
jgi:hypothetical protein